MAVSRYKNFRQVKSFPSDQRRLETFPSISMNDLSLIPHTIIKFKETDRLDHLAERFLGNATYWWVIAWYNEAPTESHLQIGDLIYIPLPLERVLKHYGI